MSVFLINCSNLKVSGGLQVADSVCGQLPRFTTHKFIVVLSKYLDTTKERIRNYTNVEVITYNIQNTFSSIVLGRDKFLDKLVVEKNVDTVLTIFGPSRWRPRVPHLSGFAMPALVIPESPFFSILGVKKKIQWAIWCYVRKKLFKRYSDCFWTENPFISKRLMELYHTKAVFTVSNYYNQIFDEPQKWRKSHTLPPFEGVTCLSVSSPIDHKNFNIIPRIIRAFKEKWPKLNIRFVLTFSYEQSEMDVPDDVRDNILFIGKVDVSEVPFLYEQSDIMFMPSLLECFSATYPEAMRMGKPIVTTDLEFARGLCEEAACYYSAINAVSAAEAIYKVATDRLYSKQLIENGKMQLHKFDNYEQRAEKLVKILESISK